MELPPLGVGTRPVYAGAGLVTKWRPGGWGQRVEERRRLADVPQPGSEVWPVLLQLLVVRGNCKELWKGRGCTECPRPPFGGLPRGLPREQEMRGWKCNPRASERYLVLVIGAQAVPGLWVVLSVPAVEREGEG